MSFTGYDSNINYAASATLGSATSTITTNGTNAASTGTLADNSGPINGNLVVSVTPVDNTLPLAPGTFTDTLTVTITPH